jgi:hypothetical protein
MPGQVASNTTATKDFAGQWRDSKIQRQDLWSGGWWRFSRYEIRDGHIRPTKNANLEWYDPWEIYRISRTDAGTRPPYEDLLKLLQSIGVSGRSIAWMEEVFQSDGSLTHAQEDKILDWCRRYGLLGILPHKAHTIESPWRLAKHRVNARHFQRLNVRMNGNWRRFVDFISAEEKANLESARESKKEWSVKFSEADCQLMWADTPDPALAPMVPTDDRIYERPRVFFDGLGKEPVSWMLPQYFPDFEDAGDQFDCPTLLSPQFWRVYSETVRDFLSDAIELLKAVVPAFSDSTSRLVAFHCLLGPVGVQFSFEGERRIQENWVCPSLLSSFGRMAFQDLSKGMLVLRCACCGAPFATSSYQGRYCSKQCGYRLRKRRARAPKTEQSKQE